LIKKEAISHRYAKAFFLEAKEKGRIDENRNYLFLLSKIMKESRSLVKVLLHPMLSREEKESIVRKAIKDPSPEFLSFILLLTSRGRLNFLPLIFSFFERLVDIEKKRIRTHLTLAYKPDDSLLELLRNKLMDFFGCDVIIILEIDEKVLGGGILKIGSKVIDGSILGHLDRLKRRIIWRR